MAVRFVEPVSVPGRLRHSATDAARWLYHAKGRAGFRRRLHMLRTGGGGAPRVCFGWLEDPANANDARIGGAVKLAHLRERFGEARRNFNLLYLVSSVIHLVPHVRELAGWAKANGARVVWNQNGVAYPAWCGEGYPWFNRPMRELIRLADFVVYQSAFCRDAADRYLGAVDCPSEILWNPVDLAHFSPRAPAEEPARIRLLAMGTNHSFYRVRASIDCLDALRERGVDAELTVAGELRWPGGDAEVRAYLHSRNLASAVRLLPRFSQEEAPGLYRGADVLLHPKYKDPCPTVPIEAMACGLPVVGSRSGGMPELVGEDAGVLVSVEDSWTRDVAPGAAAMADAVCTVARDARRYSEAARRRAEACFGSRAWTDRHEAIFRGLLDG